MIDAKEIFDCLMGVDETLAEIEEALDDKNYSLVMRKLKEARASIDDMRDDDEAGEDRQDVEMHVANRLNKG
jgi:hypothetical protein